MKELTPQRHSGRRSRLVPGLFLLVLGAVMLAVNLGYDLPAGWWQYFPVPLLVLGLVGLIYPTRHLDRSSGVWLLASGVYCLIGVFDLLGLGWGGAWPVFVIAAGLSFIVGRRNPHSHEASGPGDPHSHTPPRA